MGGLLTLAPWQLILFVNVPAGVAELVLLARGARAPSHIYMPFDPAGQVAAVLGMTRLTYGTIEVGAARITGPLVPARSRSRLSP